MISQDSGVYKAGGELGLSSMKDCALDYRSVVLTLAVNELSRPFRTEFGYHIVQLTAKKNGLYNTGHILLRVD
ncbi:MAG: peptidylprolyl isomerase [Bacteroidetes bacterium]|nr:peptidylprolyl isomerase [Fibrella sp.]